jgi:hypothetical protein
VKNNVRLSTIALLAALAVSPAVAASINLGGSGPLVDLGNGNNADATLSVDTGNLLGADDGDDTSAGGTVDLNLGDITGDDGVLDLGGDDGLLNLGGDDGLLDLGGDGDLLDLGGDGGLHDLGGDGGVVDLADIDLGDGDLLDLGSEGELLDLGDGPLLDLTGNDEVDAAIEIDVGSADLLDTGTTGSILDLDGTGDLLDLGGEGNLLDLGDNDLLGVGGSGDQDVALNLLGTDVTGAVNLEGGDEPVVEVDINTGDDGVAGTGILPSTNGNVTVGGGNTATVTVTGPGDGGTGGGGGDDPDPPGGNGNGGGGNGGNGGNGGGNGSGIGGLAAAGDDACLTLSEAQLEELIRRHTYNQATFNSWAPARQMKLVEVELCDAEVAEVDAAVDGSANVARLQAFLANQAKIRAGLQSKGYTTSDVIAADRDGGVLVVYVI